MIGPSIGAQDQAECWSEVEEIREVSEKFGAADADARVIVLSAAQHCRDGEVAEAMSRPAEGWRLLFEDAAAERLLERARTLCAEDRLADAQNNVGLVWGMLERD